MSVYVCRHADRESTHHASLLSDTGHRQARLLGAALCAELVEAPFLMSSPYGRCLQTATAVAKQVGAPRIIVEYGVCEGPLHVHGSLPEFPCLLREYPMIHPAYRTESREPCGESSQHDVLRRCEVMARCVAAFHASNNPRCDVVVVTHGTVAMGLVAAMAGGVGTYIQDVQGCCAAGYYKLAAVRGGGWATDFVCHAGHLSAGDRETETTPVCYVGA